MKGNNPWLFNKGIFWHKLYVSQGVRDWNYWTKIDAIALLVIFSSTNQYTKFSLIFKTFDFVLRNNMYEILANQLIPTKYIKFVKTYLKI